VAREIFDKMVGNENKQDRERRQNLCGDQVRRIRQERGLSLFQVHVMLAHSHLKLNPPDLDRIERVQRIVSDIELASLSRVLMVTPDQLV